MLADARAIGRYRRTARRCAERGGGGRLQARSAGLPACGRPVSAAARRDRLLSRPIRGTRSAPRRSASGCSGSIAPASRTNTACAGRSPSWRTSRRCPTRSRDPGRTNRCRDRAAGCDRCDPGAAGRWRRQRLLPRPPVHRIAAIVAPYRTASGGFCALTDVWSGGWPTSKRHGCWSRPRCCWTGAAWSMWRRRSPAAASRPAALAPSEQAALRRLQGRTLDHASMPDAVRLEMPDWLLPLLAAALRRARN